MFTPAELLLSFNVALRKVDSIVKKLTFEDSDDARQQLEDIEKDLNAIIEKHQSRVEGTGS